MKPDIKLNLLNVFQGSGPSLLQLQTCWTIQLFPTGFYIKTYFILHKYSLWNSITITITPELAQFIALYLMFMYCPLWVIQIFQTYELADYH